jgi:hypothetical protein
MFGRDLQDVQEVSGARVGKTDVTGIIRFARVKEDQVHAVLLSLRRIPEEPGGVCFLVRRPILAVY